MSSLEKLKCGHCGWIVWKDKDGQISHNCFKKCKELIMENRNLFRNDSLETHSHVENENKNNTIEESAIYDEENIENLEECTLQNIERLDEDLISAVKKKPALYDYRISIKERGRKQKDCLWQEVSVCLKGLYTAVETEKRWVYLKDCYRKARNIYKEETKYCAKKWCRWYTKNYEVKPSFRHYNVMTFLNDTLEYRQTVTSLQKSICEEQASNSNYNIPSTSSDNISSISSNNFNVDNILCPVTNNNCMSLVSPKSRKRKRIDLDDYEEVFINSITQNTEPNPIDGFVSFGRRFT